MGLRGILELGTICAKPNNLGHPNGRHWSIGVKTVDSNTYIRDLAFQAYFLFIMSKWLLFVPLFSHL